MNTNSNSYTIIYASIMVVIVAFLLAFVSSSLKEKQYQNVEQDTKKQILAALNVYDVKDVNAEYDKYVKEDDLMQADGSLVKNDAAFQTSYKGEIAKRTSSCIRLRRGWSDQICAAYLWCRSLGTYLGIHRIE